MSDRDDRAAASPMSPGPSADAVPAEPAPADEDSERGTDPASAAAPPSRRSAIMRSGFIVLILLVVFVVILPAAGVDYRQVIAAFQSLTAQELVVISIMGVAAWVVSGLIFTALIPRLSALRGTESWLILAGIGASVPLGPWNMGVLWVVVRGWGIENIPATSGIALYGLVNILSRLALPLIAVSVLALTGDLSSAPDARNVWLIAIVSIVVFVVAIALIVAIVRSERVAAWIGAKGQALVGWVMARLGRKSVPNVDGAVHRFRDQLGEVIRRRGLASIGIAIVSQFLWAITLAVALRLCGVPDTVLTAGEVFAVYGLVMVITIIPLAPGGAGIPELLFISAFTALAGTEYNAAITAGVFLYRLYFWFLPIPLAWILLKVARRGKSMLPTTGELKAYARG